MNPLFINKFGCSLLLVSLLVNEIETAQQSNSKRLLAGKLRSNHGMASVDDEGFYMFGGIGENGCILFQFRPFLSDLFCQAF